MTDQSRAGKGPFPILPECEKPVHTLSIDYLNSLQIKTQVPAVKAENQLVEAKEEITNRAKTQASGSDSYYCHFVPAY